MSKNWLEQCRKDCCDYWGTAEIRFYSDLEITVLSAKVIARQCRQVRLESHEPWF